MSETPEEQQTGVLGRIGSWLSPWRGRSPKSPTEIVFPVGAEAVKRQGEEEEENAASVSAEAGDQQWEASEHDPEPGLLRNFLPSKEQDATESARREGSPGTGAEPKGEGLARIRSRIESDKRIGNGDSRNPERNVGRLTHPSFSEEQGVAWDSDRDHTQRPGHAQAGKTLHVYLEETSVTQRGTKSGAGQEVVRTKVKKSLQVKPRASLTSDSLDDNEEAEDAVRSESYYSALVGVSLRSKKSESESSDGDSMGRKNASRRKYRKNSQGDPVNSPQEKPPPDASPAGPSRSPTSHDEPAADSAPSSQASPGGGETVTSCSDKLRYLENIQATAREACASAAMEDDDAGYKVERKTETPESKRRSMKVSRSEVMLFAKNVPFMVEPPVPEKNETLDPKPSNGAKESLDAENSTRTPDLKKINDPSKAGPGRIADRINIFERQAGEHQSTFPNPRSLEGSPVRKPPGRLKADFVPLKEESKSTGGVSRTDPQAGTGEIHVSLKQRMRNFTEKPAIPPSSARKVAMRKSPSPVASSESTELAGQGEPDTKKNSKANVPSKMEQPDKQVENSTQASETDKRSLKAKPDSLQLVETPKGSDEPTGHNAVSPKSPNRTGSKSKKKKSRESENKPEPLESKQVVKQVDRKTSSDKKTTHNKSESERTDRELENKALHTQEDSSVGFTQDEPDTAPIKPETKTPIDESLVILPLKEEKKATSRSVEQPAEKTSPVKDAAVEHHQLSRESVETGAKEVCVESVTSVAPKQTKEEVSHPTPPSENQSPKDEAPHRDQGLEKGQASVAANSQNETGTVSSELISGSSQGQQPKKSAAAVERATDVTPAAGVTNAPDSQSQTLGFETRAGPVETQNGSVPVERVKNSTDESQARGASTATHSSSTPVTKTTAAVREVNVSESSDTRVPKSAGVVSVGESSLGTEVRTRSPQRADQGGGSEKKGSVSSAKTVLVDNMTPALSQGEVNIPKTTVKVKEGESPSGSVTSYTEKTEIKDSCLLLEPKSDAPKGNTSPTSNKKPQSPSTMRRLPLPRSLSKDDSDMPESPSSWLDVDFPKQRLKVSGPRLSSCGSESNLLEVSDDLDDDDFVERIKKLCAPFQLPPRKHNTFRPPQPLFALPAIKEDRYEKTFNPEEFTFGLRKKNKFSIETPSLLARLQGPDAKSAIKPARASLADRSMLVSTLEADDKTSLKEEEDVQEEEQFRTRSRLEGSCVLSGLTSSVWRSRRNEALILDDNGEASPTESPELSPQTEAPPPSPTVLPSREEALQPAAGDSGPPFPSFNDIKLPDFLVRRQEPMKPRQDVEGRQEQTEGTESPLSIINPYADLVPSSYPGPPPLETPSEMKPPCTVNHENDKLRTPSAVTETDAAVKPGLNVPGAKSQAENKPSTHHRARVNHVRVPRRFHKRPGKISLYEKAQFSGEKYDIYREDADASSLKLSPVISVKVVRGCWILYEKPGFQGRCIPLEEGAIELPNEWAEPGQESQPISMGSLRHVVSDYSFPHIDLFTEPEGRGRVTPYHDDVIETGSFGIPLSTASIQVHSGVWMLFSDPGMQGMMTVLEAGVYPVPESWGFTSPFVGSLRPLKMGAFKVENSNEVKAVLFDSPGFEGSSQEIDGDVFSFCEDDPDALTPAQSVKIVGGLWVGYSEPGFEGQQFILEEGEYLDPSDWGGSEAFMSLRPILSDFLTPHLKMFSDLNFGQMGVNIDLSVPVGNMEDTGYGTRTQSVDVISGAWVAFEEPGFCGESYILEKGLYGSPEDWGGLQPHIASAMAVLLDDFEKPAKFKVQLFSLPGFQGTVLVVEDNLASLQEGFCVASCKVLSGSWLAFEGPDFSGKMYVLEEGGYPDLRAMGCVNTGCSIASLQTTGFEFSLPSITLFERSGLRGKRVVLTEGCVNLQLAGGCTRVQSVHVEGGMWILYEGVNYRGAQVLLTPGEVPDWYQSMSWKNIGSMRPLLQKQVHFRLRNHQTGHLMSVSGDLEEIKLLRIQELEETGGIEQIWSYRSGHLHCKLLEECCLTPSGSVTIAGSRIGLAPGPDQQAHLWSITPDGFIRHSATADLVLEVKGGTHYDKNQVILNKLDPNKPQQRWNVEII